MHEIHTQYKHIPTI